MTRITDIPGDTIMSEVETTTAEDEGRFHSYVGSKIPWPIHLLWVLFWCLAAWYVLAFLLPALKIELTTYP